MKSTRKRIDEVDMHFFRGTHQIMKLEWTQLKYTGQLKGKEQDSLYDNGIPDVLKNLLIYDGRKLLSIP